MDADRANHVKRDLEASLGNALAKALESADCDVMNVVTRRRPRDAKRFRVSCRPGCVREEFPKLAHTKEIP